MWNVPVTPERLSSGAHTRLRQLWYSIGLPPGPGNTSSPGVRNGTATVGCFELRPGAVRELTTHGDSALFQIDAAPLEPRQFAEPEARARSCWHDRLPIRWLHSDSDAASTSLSGQSTRRGRAGDRGA